MMPFGMATLITKPETCEKRKSLCKKMGRAMTEAVAYLRDHPAETLALLKKRFADARRQGVRGRLRADPQGDAACRR